MFYCLQFGVVIQFTNLLARCPLLDSLGLVCNNCNYCVIDNEPFRLGCLLCCNLSALCGCRQSFERLYMT